MRIQWRTYSRTSEKSGAGPVMTTGVRRSSDRSAVMRRVHGGAGKSCQQVEAGVRGPWPSIDTATAQLR